MSVTGGAGDVTQQAANLSALHMWILRALRFKRFPCDTTAGVLESEWSGDHDEPTKTGIRVPEQCVLQTGEMRRTLYELEFLGLVKADGDRWLITEAGSALLPDTATEGAGTP